MHVERLKIENIRSLRRFHLDLDPGSAAGWHVLLGENGSGKSSVVRSLALALMGAPNAYATREDWSRWISDGAADGRIEVVVRRHPQDTWIGPDKTTLKTVTARTQISAPEN